MYILIHVLLLVNEIDDLLSYHWGLQVHWSATNGYPPCKGQRSLVVCLFIHAIPISGQLVVLSSSKFHSANTQNKNFWTSCTPGLQTLLWFPSSLFLPQGKVSTKAQITVKPVCNDHLCNKNLLPVIYSVICFNEDWMYQFTLANNFCLLEPI